MLTDRILLGDCKDVLRDVEAGSVDLLITSPPYADSRKSNYGGTHPDQYVDWFLERSAEFKRVLNPEGTFILNIREKATDGERHTYVIELVLALKRQGWLWTEEFIWHKKNCVPGRWPNRFRDAWEHCYHFNTQKKFKMYQQEVMVPVGDWAKQRIPHLSETDHRRDPSRVNSGFGKCVANWKGRDMVFPTNVLNFATECGNRNHSAAFPEALPEWFIRLFTRPGDLVLDPFLGSGTTAVVARRMGRRFLGVDYLEENVQIAVERLARERAAEVPAGTPRPEELQETLDAFGYVMADLFALAGERGISREQVIAAYRHLPKEAE